MEILVAGAIRDFVNIKGTWECNIGMRSREREAGYGML